MNAALASDQTFKLSARRAAIAWKASTNTLPDAARTPGTYRQYSALPFCLPKLYATYNLLPEARSVALERFAAAWIPWHDGSPDTPSNHLLSSQVQCANTLAPFVNNAAALASIFGDSLPIAEVLPFGAEPHGTAMISPFDATDHVVFEWQGLANHLNEWTRRPTRGSQATSADAAIRYRNSAGANEIALIEWKYTEQYPNGHLHGSPSAQRTRLDRYQPLFDAPDGPMRTDLGLADFFAEPTYQLLRLALLADAIECTGELGATTVRVVYVAPSTNRALWASPGTPAFVNHAADHDGDLLRAWPALLRRPDRFVPIDSSQLVQADAPSSDEYKARYSHPSQ